MKGKQIEFANVQLSNDNPFVLFGGLNVLENRELSLRVAETFKVVCEDLDIPLVCKASFDKASRSYIASFRGTGREE